MNVRAVGWMGLIFLECPGNVWGFQFPSDLIFPECPCSEEISDTSQEPSPPKAFAVTRCGSSHKPGVHMSPQLHGSESGNHKGKVKVSGKEVLLA